MGLSPAVCTCNRSSVLCAFMAVGHQLWGSRLSSCTCVAAETWGSCYCRSWALAGGRRGRGRQGNQVLASGNTNTCGTKSRQHLQFMAFVLTVNFSETKMLKS